MNVLITGGAGFIGTHVVHRFVKNYPDYQIINLDALTYAGNLENLKSIEEAPNYRFVKADINDIEELKSVFETYQPKKILHLAAESHVDRSINDPLAFVRTNVFGTINLLEVARHQWGTAAGHLFYHISTDEVFGSLGDTGFFLEDTAYDPKSPYSASKAASDHFVRAYANTYQLPVIITNCSNNYGPYQFPEKLIPLVINNILHRKPIPVYGKGENVRDWLYVEDHANAIDCIFHNGSIGESYNIGGDNEMMNLDLVKLICQIMDEKLNRSDSSELISFVRDRKGHDLRYAIDASKLKSELGWKPSLTFAEGIRKTIDWYLSNELWLQSVTSGEYQKYYDVQYLG